MNERETEERSMTQMREGEDRVTTQRREGEEERERTIAIE